MSFITRPLVMAHPAEEVLEEYCMGRVKDPALAVLEEHLLVCQECQEMVCDLDEYIKLLKAAARSLENSAPSGNATQLHAAEKTSSTGNIWLSALRAPQLPRLAGIGVALGLLLLTSSSIARRPLAIETIQLTGYRGGSLQISEAQGHARRPLQLRLDAASSRPNPKTNSGSNPQKTLIKQRYRFEIVDDQGMPRWSGAASFTQSANSEGSANGLTAELNEGLTAGHYWVRLMDGRGPGGTELLAEYGLTIR
jgi:hypothetical protein